jgi:four helix bundle protein
MRRRWLSALAPKSFLLPGVGGTPSLSIFAGHPRASYLPDGRELSDRLCREVDKSATSVVLNVAEGNGRYSQLDHRRFVEIAAASAVKAAAYLDLYQQKALRARVETTPGREFLSRMVAMLNRF